MAAPEDIPSFAIIDGNLCKLNRRGTVVRRHTPMGNGIAEFIVAEGRLFVRETDAGCLLGIPNLYCLDEDLKMAWLAELPEASDAFIGALLIEGSRLSCDSRAGRHCSLDITTGKLSS